MPLAPKTGGELPPWDRAAVAALLEPQEALGALISTRRAYDSERRHR